FLKPPLHRRTRGQGRDLHAGDVILRTQTRQLVLERFFPVALVIELQSKIDVNQSGEREKSRNHNPPRQRGRVHGVEILSARGVHQIFSATRSFALRERGLRRCSFSPGSSGFEVTKRKAKSGLRRGSGHSGRSSHSRLRSRKKFFTI